MKELGLLIRFILPGAHSRCSIRNNDGEKKWTFNFSGHYECRAFISLVEGKGGKQLTVTHNGKQGMGPTLACWNGNIRKWKSKNHKVGNKLLIRTCQACLVRSTSLFMLFASLESLNSSWLARLVTTPGLQLALRLRSTVQLELALLLHSLSVWWGCEFSEGKSRPSSLCTQQSSFQYLWSELPFS